MDISLANINELADRFCEYLSAEKGLAHNSIISYRGDLDMFFNFVYGNKLNIYDKDLLIKYSLHMTQMKYNKSSISRRLTSAEQFYKFLYSENILHLSFEMKVQKPKLTKSLPRYLSIDEVLSLRAAAKSFHTLEEENARASAIVELFYATGARVSEIVSLHVDTITRMEFQVDDGRGGYTNEDGIFVLVYGKGNKERYVPIHQIAYDAILNYLKYRNVFLTMKSNFLFCSTSSTGYITRQYVGKLLKKIAIHAGIDTKLVYPHIMRHSFATHMLSNGADLRVIQELLGHSDIFSTQIYTHVNDEQLTNMISVHHPLFRNNPS